jgi:hypothetical protein
MPHQNGEWRWFSSEDRVYNRTVDGSLKHILGVARDITKRKQTEVELTNTNSILHFDALYYPLLIGYFYEVNAALGACIQENIDISPSFST